MKHIPIRVLGMNQYHVYITYDNSNARRRLTKGEYRDALQSGKYIDVNNIDNPALL